MTTQRRWLPRSGRRNVAAEVTRRIRESKSLAIIRLVTSAATIVRFLKPGLGALLACVLLGAGCVSTKPEKFAEQVRHWVPLGTSEKDAERIMTGKRFECRTFAKDDPFNACGVDYLACEREQIFQHDWSAKLFLQDGKVTGYGPMTVDEDAIPAGKETARDLGL